MQINIKNNNFQVHNFYICKQKQFQVISEEGKGDMTRQKKLFHKWLYYLKLRHC